MSADGTGLVGKTYPVALEELVACLDERERVEDDAFALLVAIALGQVSDPKGAVMDLLERHFPTGPDLERLGASE